MDTAKIIFDLKRLLKSGNKDGAAALISSLSEEEKKILSDSLGVYQSIEGHRYRGWNLYFLSIACEPGIFGTFQQWKKAGRSIRKGERGFQLSCPIMEKNSDTILFWRGITVFSEKQLQE